MTFTKIRLPHAQLSLNLNLLKQALMSLKSCLACSMLVVIGVFTFIAAVCGYIGSRFRSLFLTIYLVAGSIATLIHAVMILVCFFAFDHVVARIDAIDAKDGKLIAKYVSLVNSRSLWLLFAWLLLSF